MFKPFTRFTYTLGQTLLVDQLNWGCEECVFRELHRAERSYKGNTPGCL